MSARFPMRAPRARRRAADDVFEGLAGAILRGELEPGSALPPEHELARRFGVSPVIARSALHRLGDLGLVRVRQGSPTLVLDPGQAADLRLVLLSMELAPRGAEDEKELLERLLLAAAALLELAERRIHASEVDALDRILERCAAGGADDGAAEAMEEAYWTTVAAATRNRIYQQETRWWFDLAERRPPERRLALGDRAGRLELYRELNRRLRAGSGAAQVYLERLRPVLDALCGR